jgi:hypothetical protein
MVSNKYSSSRPRYVRSITDRRTRLGYCCLFVRLPQDYNNLFREAPLVAMVPSMVDGCRCRLWDGILVQAGSLLVRELTVRAETLWTMVVATVWRQASFVMFLAAL